MDQNALFSMLGRAQGGAPQGAAQSAGSQGGAAVGMGDLQNVLSGMGLPASTLSGMFPQQGERPSGTTQETPSKDVTPSHCQALH